MRHLASAEQGAVREGQCNQPIQIKFRHVLFEVPAPVLTFLNGNLFE
jgi:hypothetical protein